MRLSFEITLSNQTVASDDLAGATLEAGCTDATWRVAMAW